MADELCEASSQYIPNDTETYDQWFERQVKIGLREADDPNTVMVSNEEVFRRIDERLAKLADLAGFQKAS